MSFSSEHVAWRDMKSRCLNPDHPDYPRYGARGITVCERWLRFDDFYADMGLKPGKAYSLERNDNDGNYEPSNCRWATSVEQNRNKSNAYTADEDQRIREAVAGGHNFTQMAAIVGRSKSSVMMRTYRLGLKSGQPPIPKQGLQDSQP